MSNGVLSLPGSKEKVDVVYKAPRMICASEHTIKLYTSKLLRQHLSASDSVAR